MRTLLTFLLTLKLCLAPLAAQIGDRSDQDQSNPPASWKIPPAPVRTPEESIKLFDLPPGFRAEIVAAEPLVQDPVAIYFDERGRLWVLEWPDYNKLLRGVIPGLDNIAPEKSRLVILEDTNGDGRMDRRTIFMDGIEWPRGVQISKNGALVMKLPQIVHAQDRDGDGKADHEEVLVDGMAIPMNPHGAPSSPLRMMDNWIYASEFPQRIRAGSTPWAMQPSPPIRGQWGFSQDNFGRLVYATNGTHLKGDLVPIHYYGRNPNFTATAGVDVRYNPDQTAWPHASTPGTNRRSQQRDEDGSMQVFTSNTAPTVYRGNQFPAEYVGNVFLGDVAGRLIRRSILTEKDGIITAENAYQRREFLFSHDERFRAVYTANGPDGALYIADMYRGIIEGHLFITSYLRKQILDRGLQHPFNGMGRIYRIVHEGSPRPPMPKLDRENPASWVALLGHPNGFWRDTAQRLIVESADRRTVPALRTMAREHRDVLARLHALWTLEGLDALTPEILTPALADPSFRIRQAAVRLSEPFLTIPEYAGKVIALAGDERVEVRRQLMFSLGEGRGPVFEQAMARLLQRNADQPFMVEAAMSGLRDREYAVLESLLNDPAWVQERAASAKVLGALAHAVLNSGKDAELERLLRHLSDDSAKLMWMRTAVLDGLVDAKKRGLANLPASLAALESSREGVVRQSAEALRKSWTSPAPPVRATRELAGPVFERGEALYAICSACHGPEGKGQPGIAPPLVDSVVVAGPADQFIRTVLNGRNQDRSNPAYPDMPPLAGLPDEDVAALVSYVRARWIGYRQPVTPQQVLAVRAGGTPAPSAPRK